MIRMLLGFAFVLMLASIGLLIFGIVNKTPMIPIAMALLVTGISLLTVANAQNAKNKKQK